MKTYLQRRMPGMCFKLNQVNHVIDQRIMKLMSLIKYENVR